MVAIGCRDHHEGVLDDRLIGIDDLSIGALMDFTGSPTFAMRRLAAGCPARPPDCSEPCRLGFLLSVNQYGRTAHRTD
jgi:hypothetical protein